MMINNNMSSHNNFANKKKNPKKKTNINNKTTKNIEMSDKNINTRFPVNQSSAKDPHISNRYNSSANNLLAGNRPMHKSQQSTHKYSQASLGETSTPNVISKPKPPVPLKKAKPAKKVKPPKKAKPPSMPKPPKASKRRMIRIKRVAPNITALITLTLLFITLLTVITIGISYRNSSATVMAASEFYGAASLLPAVSAAPVPSLNMSDYAAILGDEIYSSNVIMLDVETNSILCMKNPYEITYPASLTKMMTALLAIEEIDDLNAEIKMTQDIYDIMFVKNASTAGFIAGEEVKAIDLVYGVMLPSGGDASLALARYISGSEESFAELMNKKAVEIGLTNTNFVNCTGLHDPEHYSTASDMAKLMLYAIENETFKQILTTQSYTSSATNLHKRGVSFSSSMFSTISRDKYTNMFITGGKTGYTTEAKLCLASIATDGNREYILITMGAGDGTSQVSCHIADAIAIYDEYLTNV